MVKYCRGKSETSRKERYTTRILYIYIYIYIYIGPEAHPAYYTMVTGSFPGIKGPRRGI